MDRLKLMICGHGRHGKDTVAEYLTKEHNYRFMSASHTALDLFIYGKLNEKYNYSTREECYEDRQNHRAEWYDMIVDYCKEDAGKLAKYVLSHSEIYVGVRSIRELDAARSMVDKVIWVDRSEHLPPEPKDSNEITPEMCDMIIDNNGTLEDLYTNIDIMLDLD